ncbi:exopolysaccharide biosynthesis protein [Sagittula sp. SSi028]|uniref:exopolysaccharide biosynthesis protein n=1 Tax=Sagittula sp. SSi028 TaxID=3400636 RepID=UPI003AF68D96
MTELPSDRQANGPESLGDLLAAMTPDEGQERVSVENVLGKVGGRSFPAVILVPCVVLVSPLSGIPLTPTLGGLVVLLITLQVLIGRKHLWLPDFLSRRSVPAHRMQKAIDWLSKPAAFMDRHSHNRLRILTSGPARYFAYLTTSVLALSWPPLELLPFVTSFSAGAVAMIMYGLMVRDGAYTLAGYVQAVVLYLALLSLWIGVF